MAGPSVEHLELPAVHIPICHEHPWDGPSQAAPFMVHRPVGALPLLWECVQGLIMAPHISNQPLKGECKGRIRMLRIHGALEVDHYFLQAYVGKLAGQSIGHSIPVSGLASQRVQLCVIL